MEFGPSLPNNLTTTSVEDAAQLPCSFQRSLTGHEGPVLAIRFNVQGAYCISCGKVITFTHPYSQRTYQDRTARLWNPYRGTCIKSYTGHGYEVRDACIAEDNASFITCGGDRQIFLWDVSSGQTIRKLRGHEGVINTVAYAADEAVLLSGGYDKSVNVWDLRSRSTVAIQQLSGFKDSVTCVAATRNEILASGVDGILKRFDLRAARAYVDQFKEPITRTPERTNIPVRDACLDFALSQEATSVLCALMADAVLLMDKTEGTVLATYKGHRHRNLKIECGFAASDAFAFAGSEDGYVFFWEYLNGMVVRRFKAHDDCVCSCALHQEQNALLTASTDGVIKFWH